MVFFGAVALCFGLGIRLELFFCPRFLPENSVLGNL